ncbi:MAG: 5-oxoprolinase subunit PxpB [Gracilimonas sp.]|nr:5-oxoprolinase subunit PxpB [Gracilimonas sp.]
MASRSLQIDNTDWNLSTLGEAALVLEPDMEDPELSAIHKVCSLIEDAGMDGLTDVIPTYKSIGLLFEEPVHDMEPVIDQLEEIFENAGNYNPSHKTIRVPVCYELGLDWDELESHTGLQRDEIIRLHTAQQYTVAMMGFIPGFLYLQGLDQRISCPRKNEPRTKVPEGAVGIAGDQTGIYSLESPGGWQILGRTPLSFFDGDNDPPVSVNLGDTVIFEPISEEDFTGLKMDSDS